MKLSDSEIMEDALDVHEETGLTPSQLAEQRAALIKVLESARSYGADSWSTWLISEVDAALEQCK